MSYFFGESGLTAATQKIQAIDQTIKTSNINPLIQGLININQSIKKLDIQPGSQPYILADKLQSSVNLAIQKLSTTKEQRFLDKIKAASFNEDLLAILGVFALFSSMLILAYVTRR